MPDLLNPRLMIYLLSSMHRVPKYIYTKPPTYNTSRIIQLSTDSPKPVGGGGVGKQKGPKLVRFQFTLSFYLANEEPGKVWFLITFTV